MKSRPGMHDEITNLGYQSGKDFLSCISLYKVNQENLTQKHRLYQSKSSDIMTIILYFKSFKAR